MTTYTITHHTDSPTLKRSFTPDNSYQTPPSGKKVEPAPVLEAFGTQALSASFTPPLKNPRARRRSSGRLAQPQARRGSGMPVQTSSRPIAVPMPSFMSVFGGEVNTGAHEQNGALGRNEVFTRPAASETAAPPPNGAPIGPWSALHQHRDSTSTSASDSTDSSPTTTVSTVDSSSMTEPSPGPSPESPDSKPTQGSFVADFRSRRGDGAKVDSAGPAPFFELQRPNTPAKRAKNLKNLGINTTTSPGFGRTVSTASLPMEQPRENTSEPSSPSFIKPPAPAKRKPSNLNLSIQTPGVANAPSLVMPSKLAIPPTPSFKRPNTLRHFQSSPSLPLVSPSLGPENGMKFPLRPGRISPRGFAEVPQENEEEEQEPNFDIPQSREEKPASYPAGPICIYESGVYLYYEPTADTAAQYDVILNVASEVKNPFAATNIGGSKSEPASPDRSGMALQTLPAIESAAVDFSAEPAVFSTVKVDQPGSPDTPKATPIIESHPPPAPSVPDRPIQPEYIHIPWEHNTDIVPDLYQLVKLIDDRVQQGKRVLVHCQCGVSRSASLIVAYGMFKNPGISVQEAYDAVKKRSKWIGPNMNLIMQLQEFRNGLLRANGDRSFHDQVYGLRLPRTATSGLNTASIGSDRRPSPFGGDASNGSRTPRTAPLPAEEVSAQRASTGNIAISPGPMSAPFWQPEYRKSWAASESNGMEPPSAPAIAPPRSVPDPYVDPKGQILSSAQVSQAKSPTPVQETLLQESLPKRPVPNFSRLSVRAEAPPPLLQPQQTEQNRSNSLVLPMFSPRSEEFHMTPLQPRPSEMGDMFGMLSPIGGQSATTQTPATAIRDAPVPDFSSLLSPGATSRFPAHLKDDEPETNGLMSPRASEFHMTPVAPKEGPSDPFGMFSPFKSEFSADVHHPVQTLAPPPPPYQALPQSSNPSLSIPIATSQQPQEQPQQQWARASTSAPPMSFLATPPRQRNLQKKISSPSLAEQRLLHRIQSNLEEKVVPHKSPSIGSPSSPQADDMEALLSPRATEFTKNPFHTALEEAITEQHVQAPAERDGSTTPRPSNDDPRSPAQTGVSPIVRSIWDVL